MLLYIYIDNEGNGISFDKDTDKDTDKGKDNEKDKDKSTELSYCQSANMPSFISDTPPLTQTQWG